jgi:hypothetical protein
MQRKELEIQKLQEVRDEIPGIKEREVTYKETAEFSAWRAKGIKWLKLGLPFTKDELYSFQVFEFAVPRVREDAYDYDEDDQLEYERDCDRAAYLLDSAIENLQMGLVPDPPVSELLKALEKEIEAKVTDANEKRGLRQKLKELSENPAAVTVMGQGVGELLRRAFGG